MHNESFSNQIICICKYLTKYSYSILISDLKVLFKFGTIKILFRGGNNNNGEF